MTKAALLLRSMWAVIGAVMAVLLALATLADVLVFALAYGSPAGSYGGQAGDRHLAWLLLILLAVLWVFLLVAIVWPAMRWRRRGMLSQPEAAEE